jgi:hypothetical protein
MPTLHERMVRAALDGMLDQLDIGSADPTGDCRLLNAGNSELAQLTFANPAFAPSTTISANVAEAQSNTVAQDSSVTAGTFTQIQWRDRDNVVLVAGSVGLAGSGANLIVTDNVIPPATDAVTCPGLSGALVLV